MQVHGPRLRRLGRRGQPMLGRVCEVNAQGVFLRADGNPIVADVWRRDIKIET